MRSHPVAAGESGLSQATTAVAPVERNRATTSFWPAGGRSQNCFQSAVVAISPVICRPAMYARSQCRLGSREMVAIGTGTAEIVERIRECRSQDEPDSGNPLTAMNIRSNGLDPKAGAEGLAREMRSCVELAENQIFHSVEGGRVPRFGGMQTDFSRIIVGSISADGIVPHPLEIDAY